MDVDNAVFEFLNKGGAEDTHVADEDNEVNLFFFQNFGNFEVECFARFVFGIDKNCFVAVFAGALKGITVFFVGNDDAEFDI